ncbi:MAG TPA: hypothetical protein VF821_18555 [Lentzea sp.]
MTRLLCFGLGVAIGVVGLLALSRWADARDERFHLTGRDWTG